jgi:hypothetical protein
MRAFSKWLLRDEQRDFFEYLFANVLNLLFLALIALLLWPLGRLKIALQLAKGYWIFWTVVIICAALSALFARIFRIEQRPPFWAAYLILILMISGVLLAGWSAFAALTLSNFTEGSSIGVEVTLRLIGLLSCYVAYVIASALFNANRFRLANLIVALVAYVLFSLWPQSAIAMFGWFFNRF